ncbi:hypothetical protein [Clostridium grantii]|uniref:Uncharacterized protein n=1 Tax=Clostridium grantii DSM 8605 TaxID=1121316 RepID=A0A1M5XC42_9CLOT|nr:hypothetical protein [Clostridium grantii]SHH96763.1 hypothetical protein SAMN02745207_03493 [Clostridium grantii DSM 8605]
MSLYLGQIHYWLFNKINLFELGEKDIKIWAKKEGLKVDEWEKEIYDEFGEPLENKPLEDMIDTGNIHGWLQDKISRAEYRYATLVTRILEVNKDYINDLNEIMNLKGNREGKAYDKDKNSLESIYNVINDYVVEGMPCDRINEIIESSNTELTWKRTRCLHKQYWDFVGGNVENYYILRESWIKAFLKSINEDLAYREIEDGLYKIQLK